ncbi:MAG TPA: 50S ribosomal protein L9, partial [Phycisphaerales bacterium]|nr:50S ribosomal protein L9 [Phycisphaerales bacterium]
TGIVGDVVNVRKGFARNFLLPRGLAETPSEAKIKDLQSKRKEAIKHLAELRKSREALVEKLEGHELTMIRSCNDLGILYAAVTQHEIAAELEKAGFKGIADREVRLGQPIKRVGDYPITIKFQLQAVPEEETSTKAKAAKKEDNAPLEAHVQLHVKPDRELNIGRRDRDEAPKAAEGEGAAPAEGAEGDEGKRAKDKSAKFDTAKPGQKKDDAGEKPAKAPKAEKADKGEKKTEKKK